MKILLADDDPFYRYSLRKTLQNWGYDVILAENGKDALNVLQSEDSPNLAIIDWMMPGMDGVEVCRQIRAQARDKYVYILLLTARNNKDDVIKGLEAQADDYIIKPFDPQELRMRLLSGRRIITLQDILASKQRELCHQATHDSLTGIWNRKAIIDILERESALPQKSRRRLCLAMADIDNFKHVNDTYGHVAGDAVLVEVVQRIQSGLRRLDNVGRYGGEEFVIVMPDVTPKGALKIAERLCRRVAERSYEAAQQEISITLSVGIAIASGGGDIGLLLRSADEALYQAKALGRNRVEFASTGAVKERRGRRRQLK